MDLPSTRVSDVLEALASKSPTPGGGACAALAGAIGAALGSMVVAYSVGRKDMTAHDAVLAEASAALVAARRAALEAAARDMASYAALNEAMKMPKDAPERAEAVSAAALAAALVPLELAELCAGTLATLEGLCGKSNRFLASDLAAAAVLLEAGARSAVWNVRVNLPMIADRARAEALGARATAAVRASVEAARRVEDACAV